MEKEKQIQNQYNYDHVIKLSSESGDLFLVEKSGKRGVYSDSRRTLVVPIEYDYIYSSHPKNCLRVEKDKRFGVFSVNEGKMIVPVEYDSIIELIGSDSLKKYDGQYRVHLGDKIGVFNPKTSSVTWQ